MSSDSRSPPYCEEQISRRIFKDKVYLAFSGVAPVATTTAQSECDEFANQLTAYFHLPAMTFVASNKIVLGLCEQEKRKLDNIF